MIKKNPNLFSLLLKNYSYIIKIENIFDELLKKEEKNLAVRLN